MYRLSTRGQGDIENIAPSPRAAAGAAKRLPGRPRVRGDIFDITEVRVAITDLSHRQNFLKGFHIFSIFFSPKGYIFEDKVF